MIIVIYLAVFLLGLLFGSFLNVCIYRIPRGESVVHPPSHCTGCGNRLKLRDLVPILSYIFLKGKCRYCGSGISPRYPVIELATGLMYLLLFDRFGFTVDFIAYTYLMSILVAVFMIDFDHKIIPNGLVIAGLVGTIPIMAYHAIYPMEIYRDETWWSPLLGVLPGTGFLLLIALVGLLIYKTDDAMGMGDVKLFAPIGIFLGWRLCFLALLLSVLLAGLTSLLLIITGKKKRKDTIPFGPFIVSATFIVIMWGWRILDWYFGGMV